MIFLFWGFWWGMESPFRKIPANGLVIFENEGVPVKIRQSNPGKGGGFLIQGEVARCAAVKIEIDVMQLIRPGRQAVLVEKEVGLNEL
jgi:hypothetical protein